MSSQPIEQFLARLDKVGTTPTGWIALCPSHEDRHPSLSITESDEGHVLLNCFAGCRTEDICSAIGLREADLFEHDEYATNAVPHLKKIDKEEISLQVWFAAVFVADKRAGRSVSDADADTYDRCILSMRKALGPLLEAQNYKLASQVATVLMQYLNEKKAHPEPSSKTVNR